MRGLILGFDGVLVDDLPVHLELLCQVLEGEGLSVATGEMAGYLESGDASLDLDRRALATALAAHGEKVDSARLSRLAARKAAFYQLRLRREGHRVIAGGRQLVERAARSGWMLGLVTATPRGEVVAALEALDLETRFKTLVTSSEVEDAGVGPEAHRRAWQELNALPPLPTRLLHPHEVVAVHASPAALAAAAASGFTAIGVTTRHPAGELRDADQVVEDPAEVELPGLADEGEGQG